MKSAAFMKWGRIISATFCLWTYSQAVAVETRVQQTNAGITKSPPALVEDQNLPLNERISRSKVFFEPLVISGRAPTANESIGLWNALEVFQTQGIDAGLQSLEHYIAVQPNSPWTPSLEANLGKYYREQGRYTKALQHWESAWNAMKGVESGGGKQVADFTFAHWTKLLASLGRKETMGQLFAETANRNFDGGQLQGIINSTKEAYHVMQKEPGVAFKCGTFALNSVIRSLKVADYDQKAIADIPSPADGFSLTFLAQLANKQNLGLVPVQRVSGQELIVPSVIHWKQNHYAAIVEQRENFYKVVDPTFGKPKWMSGEVINEEASGWFLVPKDKTNNVWRQASASESDQIAGKGYPSIFAIIIPPCPTCPAAPGTGVWTVQVYVDVPQVGAVLISTTTSGSNGSSGGNGSGGWNPLGNVGAGSGSNAGGGWSPLGNQNGSGCSSCSGGGRGMAIWGVQEPYINLWLKDIPWSYSPPRGPEIAFLLQYSQREPRPFSTNVFNFGPLWNCDWLSYLSVTDQSNDPNYPNYDATLYASGGGGVEYLYSDTNPEYYTTTKLQRLTDTNGTLTAFQVQRGDGSKTVYGYLQTNLVGGLQAFQTSKADPSGNAVFFNYQTTTNNILQLTSVVDAVGQTNTLAYSTNAPAQVTSVTDAYGHIATLQYNTNGYLTNITDVVGITSSFLYDTNGWVTNLTTPYGTTVFRYTNTALIDRAIEVTQPNGGRDLYVYRELHNAYDPEAYPHSEMLADPTDPYSYAYVFNSAHWGPLQYSHLSTTNISNLTTNDYKIARNRIWRGQFDYLQNAFLVSGTMAIERQPSPDGIIEGQKVFYSQGTGSIWPTNITQFLPDGTTNSVTTSNNEWGKVTNVVSTWSNGIDLLLRTNSFIYSSDNIDLKKHIGPRGNVLSAIGYNTNHQVVAYTNAAGYVSTYIYNSNGQLLSATKPSGFTTTNIYDSNGWLSKSIDIDVGKTNLFTYVNGLLQSQTDELGLTMTNYWDSLNRVTGIVYNDGTTISNIYRNLDIVARKDKLGNWTYFDYDSNRNLISETNELGYVWRYNYCNCGNLENITNALNQVTSFTYDLRGMRTGIQYADNTTATFSYDLLGRMSTVADGAGLITTNYYSNQGTYLASSNAFGCVNCYRYNIDDLATNETTKSGAVISYVYDDAARLVKRSQSDGGYECFVYSESGVIAYTNQLNSVTSFKYDTAGRQLNETNANGSVTSYSYNARGLITSVTDAKNQVTSWAYDQYGRVTNKVNAAGAELMRYQYDANNRLTNRWHIVNGDTSYKYDTVGNLTNISYQSSSNLYFIYDPLNRMTNMIDGVGVTQYQYSAADDLISENEPWSVNAVKYEYYPNHLRKSLTITNAGNIKWIQTYSYDAGARLKQITSPAGVFSYDYFSIGGANSASLLVNKISIPNGSYVTNTFDSVGRKVSTVLVKSDNAIINSHTYSYDVGSQKIKETFTQGNFKEYAYDNLGQMKSSVGKESDTTTYRLAEQLGYAYDTAGNLMYRTNNALLQSFSVNNLNQISNVTRSGTITVSGASSSVATNITVNGFNATQYSDRTFAKDGISLVDGTNTFTVFATNYAGIVATNQIVVNMPTQATYSYDSGGNLLSDGWRAFSYDNENQLSSIVVSNQWKTEFLYDGKMRRRIQREYCWQGGSWSQTNEVRYVYDGNLVIQELDSSNAAVVTYTRGLDISGSLQGAGGIGGLLGRSQHQTQDSTSIISHAFYHSDANGNITTMLNAQQSVVARYGYDNFGNILFKEGVLADANAYRFSSKEYDNKSKLIYYLYRWYDSGLQRWLSCDPKAELGGINLYEFVGNAAANSVDPYGLDEKPTSTITNKPVQPTLPIITGIIPKPLKINPNTTIYWTPPDRGVNCWGTQTPFLVPWATNYIPGGPMTAYPTVISIPGTNGGSQTNLNLTIGLPNGGGGINPTNLNLTIPIPPGLNIPNPTNLNLTIPVPPSGVGQ